MEKKYNLIVPLAGLGSRFVKEGYILPKPLILVDNKSIVEWTMQCVDYSECNLIFIVRKEHVVDFNIDGYLKSRFGNDIHIIEVDKVTQGAVCSCLLAEKYIDNDKPLIIHCSDIYFEPKFNPSQFDETTVHGAILTFKSNSKNYSYVQIDENHKAKRTAEKEVISPHAAVGIYYFKKGTNFVDYARDMIQRKITTNDEYYICPLYNLLIQNKYVIETQEVDKMHIFGTPEELKFFVNNSLKTWPRKKTIAICSDHSGFDVKEQMKKVITENDMEFVDFGVYDKTIDRDYFEYVRSASDAVVTGACDFGIGFCRSGQGVNICANKIKGIRSAWVMDEYLAEYAIRHGCCNFFALSSKYVNDMESMRKILKAILNNTFDGGRHQVRISKLE